MRVTLKNVLYVLAVLAVCGGTCLHRDAKARDAENEEREALLLKRAHICVREVKVQRKVVERGFDLKLDAWTEEQIDGKQVVLVAAKYVGVRPTDSIVGPIISARCEFAGPKSERLIAVHSEP